MCPIQGDAVKKRITFKDILITTELISVVHFCLKMQNLLDWGVVWVTVQHLYCKWYFTLLCSRSLAAQEETVSVMQKDTVHQQEY